MLPVFLDSEVRKRVCRKVMRTEEDTSLSGDHRGAAPSHAGGRLEPFHSALDVDLAHAHVMDVVAMGTIEFQRQLPILAETLHVHLDAGGRLSARIRTGKEKACHSNLLRALKK